MKLLQTYIHKDDLVTRIPLEGEGMIIHLYGSNRLAYFPYRRDTINNLINRGSWIEISKDN